jgi:glycosyltransferase involved in cell wall biosynthesis
MRNLIYIDSSYRLSDIQERKLNHVLDIRFADGLFDQVWSAHPIDVPLAGGAGVSGSGRPLATRLSESHVFVRGRYGRFQALAWFPALNALLALGSFVLELICIAKREKIKIVRAGDPLLCGLIGLLVARISSAKLVVRVNGDHDLVRKNSGKPMNAILFRSSKVEKWIEKAVLRRADRIIVPSSFYGEFARRNGAPQDRIVLVKYGNLIDPRHLTPPDERDALDNALLSERLNERPWMVYVGRLHQAKHAEHCYEVLRRLANEGYDVGLLMIGEGPLRSAITASAKAHGLQDRVLFLGNTDQPSLARILPRCTLALSPLTGRALVEVAFAALAVVAYDLDWQSELVDTDVTGILVPAGDISAMTQGVAKLLGDKALRERLGNAIRERASALLDPQEQTRKEIEAYRSLGVLQ